MNVQQQIPEADPAMAPRSNGFRNRRIFSVPGTYTFTLPEDLPTGEDGMVPVKEVVLGGGQGGTTFNAGANKGGNSAGYSERIRRHKPGATVTVVVGAAGLGNGNVGDNFAGGTTSHTWDDGVATIQATGGSGAGPGVGSGGDINYQGAYGAATNNAGTVAGACAPSPWGPGRQSTGQNGERWKKPLFWDLDDNIGTEAFLEFHGLGHGGSTATGTLPSDPPGPGGGGAKNQAADIQSGGAGWSAIYW